MKTLNGLTKLIMTVIAAGLLMVIWSIWPAGRAGAADHRDGRVFGMISLNPGATARLNVCAVNFEEQSVGARTSHRVMLGLEIYAPQSPGATQGGASAEAPCGGKLQIVARRLCEAMLNTGEAASFDFTAPPEGAMIRPIVNPDSPDAQIFSSLELREGGRVTAILNPNHIQLHH